jgi:hypothetical protein
LRNKEEAQHIDVEVPVKVLLGDGRIPNFLFQNPKNRSAPNNHSETPRNQLAPRRPKTGYIQEIRGPLLIKGINVCTVAIKPEEWKANLLDEGIE